MQDKDKKKKKKQSKKQRQNAMEEAKEEEKKSWLSFSAGNKTIAKTATKKSIFASPDNFDGKVRSNDYRFLYFFVFYVFYVFYVF